MEQPNQPDNAQPPAPPTAPAAVATIAQASAVTSRINAADLAQWAAIDKERATSWMTALVDAEVARQCFAQDLALARQFATSGQFDDLKAATAEQAIATAMAKIQLGRSWGFNAADAIRYVYFVNGKPAVENEIIASKLQQAGLDWDIEWLEETIQHKGKPWQKCIGCRLWLKRWSPEKRTYEDVLDRSGNPVSVAFTEGDAEHAMVWEKGKQIPLNQKSIWQSWARDMYFWRCISRLKKYHAPNVLRGAVAREEALETIPAYAMQPGQLPGPKLVDNGEAPIVDVVFPPDESGPEVAPEPVEPDSPKPRLRDRIMNTPSFFGHPATETATE